MTSLRTTLRALAGTVLLAGAGLAVGATPAAADPSLRPLCSIRLVSPTTEVADCVNGSALWSYRISIYCAFNPATDPRGYVVQSPWQLTVYPITVNCQYGGVIVSSWSEMREERPA